MPCPGSQQEMRWGGVLSPASSSQVCPLSWVPQGPSGQRYPPSRGSSEEHSLQRAASCYAGVLSQAGKGGLVLLTPGLRSLGSTTGESSSPGVSPICSQGAPAEEDSDLGGVLGPAETCVGKRDNSVGSSQRGRAGSALHPCALGTRPGPEEGAAQPPPPLHTALSHWFPSCSEVLF